MSAGTRAKWLCLLIQAHLLVGQSSDQLPPSPCPSVFSYEGREAEQDRWYGVILVMTDVPLTGLRLDVQLNRPADLLGNWEGEVTTNDNTRFTILDLNKMIAPGPPTPIRIFVKFSKPEERGIPVVETIALNGRTICLPSEGSVNYHPHSTEKPWRPSGTSRRPLEIESEYQESPARPLRPNELSPTPDYDNAYSVNERPRPAAALPTRQSTSLPSVGYDSDFATKRSAGGYNHEGEFGRPSSTKRPASGYNHDGQFERPSTKRPASGYNRDDEFERPPSTKRPASSYNHDGQFTRPPSTKRPANGYNRDGEFERPPSTKRPASGYNHDGEFARPPSTKRPASGYNRDGEFERPPSTKRPASGYNRDGEFERPPSMKRPASGYNRDDEFARQPPNKQAASGYDGEFERPSSTKRPASGYDGEFARPPSNKQPANGYDGEFARPPSTKRPANGHESEFARPPSNKQPTSGYDGEFARPPSTKRPGDGYNNNRRPSGSKVEGGSIATTTRRSAYNHGTSDHQRRPTTLNAEDQEVEWIATRSPDGEDLALKPNNAGEHGCGRIHVSATPLVTNGRSTSRGQWPWHAALYKAKGIDLTYICGGTLVSTTVVLTAAHCVTKIIGNRPVDPDDLVVYLGKHHLKLWSEGGVQNRQVTEVHVHPHYNGSDFRSDVAALVLSIPADYTPFVRPACLWGDDDVDLGDVEGRIGYVVGWGYDEESRVTEELTMAHMPIVSQQTCLWSYPEFYSHFTSNKTYCAGFKNGTSVCNGDSGGGMVLPEEQTDGSRVWRLRGLVSISVSKEEKRVCDTEHYVVFTDLAKYRNWIHRFVK